LRGFAKLSSLFSFLALLSALFWRIDLPAFLAAPLLGDFPDIGITPFFACVTQYHTCFYFLSQSCKNSGDAGFQLHHEAFPKILFREISRR
jgi:hypothetical protein